MMDRLFLVAVICVNVLSLSNGSVVSAAWMPQHSPRSHCNNNNINCRQRQSYDETGSIKYVGFRNASFRSNSNKFATTKLYQAKAGSFFNEVPSEKDKDNSKKEDDSDDQNSMKSKNVGTADVNELIRTTTSAKGFGKPLEATTSVQRDAKTKKTYVGVGPVMNDVTKPEYDENGYTLYANEKTGQKSRVFEALVDYPCEFSMKVVGTNTATFVTEILDIVQSTCTTTEEIRHATRINGKWISITVHAPVKDATMLYNLYSNIDEHPLVKFKF